MREISLIDYLPPFVQEYREIQKIAETENPEFELLWDWNGKIRDNLFVLTADEIGVKRYEQMLGISPKAVSTLDNRKFTILTYLVGQRPYTYRKLKTILAELCGGNGFVMDLDIEHHTLKVMLLSAFTGNVSDVESMLRRVCPANLIIIVSIGCNPHWYLSKLTHEQLSKYTHYQLRNEEILVPEPPKPPEPPDFTAPTLSVESGTYPMSITVYVVRPKGYENMTVFYYLDDDYSTITPYDDDKPFTFTSSHTISLFGIVDDKPTVINTYTYIIEQPHFSDTMKLDSVKMSDSVSFASRELININAEESIKIDNIGAYDSFNYSLKGESNE